MSYVAGTPDVYLILLPSVPYPLAYLWVWPVKITDKEIRGREGESELDCLNANPSFSL